MPFTFLAHQAVVLPLKRAWPHRVDGLALVVGSTAPDLPYALLGTRLAFDAHTLPALVCFCVPATVALAWWMRHRMLAVLAAHAPDVPGFAVRDYGRVASHRHPLAVSAGSALVGAWSHVALDACTHANGGVVARVGLLRATVPLGFGRDEAVYELLQSWGSAGLALLALWMLRRVGERRLLQAWCPSPREPLPRPSLESHALLWGAFATVTALAAPSLVLALDAHRLASGILRFAAWSFAGLALGCELSRQRWVTARSRRE